MVQNKDTATSQTIELNNKPTTWAEKIVRAENEDKREQPWKKAFKDHDKGIVEDDWCNLKLPNGVQNNNMAA
jgi:hypothetical protein